jgi:hypothetical protein
MSFSERPSRGIKARPSDSIITNRPKSSLPEGYTPNSTLPPGYMPPQRDLQKTGAMAREAQNTTLSRGQIFGLAAGGLVLIVVVAVAATLLIGAIFVQGSLGGPDTTLDTFYNALREQNYVQAYDQLSPAQRSVLSLSSFSGDYEQDDTVYGPISDFEIDTPTVNGNQATATVHVTRTITQNATTTISYTLDTVTLVVSNGAWYIDHIDTRTLNITPTPLSSSIHVQPGAHLD